MSTPVVDYSALAKQYGGQTVQPGQNVDYAALAKQFGATQSTPAPQSGPGTRFVQSFSQAVGAPDRLSDFLSGPAYMLRHPLDSASLLLHGASDAQQQTIDKAYQEQQSPNLGTKAKGLMRGVYASLPLVGPALSKAGDQFGSGDVAGGLGTTSGLATAALAGSPEVRGNVAGAVKSVADVPLNAPLRGALESRMAQVPVGERFSRAQVVDAAQNKGVNLDLAQATESGILNAAKKANRYSLASQGTYDAAATKNLNALEQWADSEASKYSPDAAGREVVGPQVQSALKNDLEAKKASAQQAFNEIDQANGSVPVDVSNSIATEAQKIIANNKDYYAKHPELKPGKAWAILEDLASKTPGKPVPKMLGNTSVIDALGSPVMQKGIAGGPKIEPWSDLHQLRSDLMDFYRNNPDIVKGRSEAWIQQMVGKIDESMTNGASGLSPDNLAKFRQANDIWGNIKSTYDNPQSPYYHAVRSGTPSQVPGMLAKGNPELAKSVRATLGSLEGPFQRQFVENLLNDKSGALDLRNLNSRLSRVPDDFLVSMLGEDGANNLRMLGKVSQKVTFDANPSGTAKVGVPAAEVSGFFSNPLATGAELATQRVGAKLMNSPKVLNYLTKKK